MATVINPEPADISDPSGNTLIITTPTGTTGTTAAPDPHTAPAGGNRAPAFNEVYAGTVTASSLDVEGTKYLQALKEALEKEKGVYRFKDINTGKIEGLSVIHDGCKRAINILLSESNQPFDNICPAARAYEARMCVEMTDPTISVMQTNVITPLDYARVNQYAAFIHNFFYIQSGDAAAMTVKNLAGLKFSVVTNIDMVREFFRKNSPHAVPARDDIGVLICIEEQRIHPILGTRITEPIPFIGITGYTRILDTRTPGAKMIPIPTITDILCARMPKKEWLSLALPIAADAFILQSLWTQPYKDLSKGKPNLGALVWNGTKAEEAKTIEQLRYYISTLLCPPYLAIDITEGRARLVSIDALINMPDVVFDKVAEFLDTPHFTWDDNRGNKIPPFIMEVVNVTGQFMDKGMVRDTRCVDYLDLATKVSDPRTIADFLVQDKDEMTTFNMIKNIHPAETTKALYRTTTVVLNAQVINWMTSALHNAHIDVKYDIPASGTINIDYLLRMTDAANFQQLANLNQNFSNYSYFQGPNSPNIYGHI